MPHQSLLSWLPPAGVSLIVSVAVTLVALRGVRTVTRRSVVFSDIQHRAARPAVVLAAIIALSASLGTSSVTGGDRHLVGHALTLGLIATLAWLVVCVVFVAQDTALRRYDVDVSDNLRARKMRTQVLVLRRVTVIVVTVLAGAAMLTTFHQVRALGTSLLASAGLIGLAAGTAARPTIANLAAGMQIAFSEPVRLDDVVVVEGEWGRIEEITLTYVVVRVWDSRRLVLPISYFVEKPFQNWTRSTAEILGSVFFHLDYSVPLDEMRTELDRILASSRHWDGRVGALQVTDTTERTIEVRALMSATDSGAAFELRCEVRERMIGWLRANHPESLPRIRAAVDAPQPAHM